MRSVAQVVAGVALLALPQAGWADTRRFALIAGANDGGAERVVLRYAVSDAQSFGSVMEELGGVPRSNQTLLIEPDTDILEEAIANLGDTVALAEDRGMRTEVVFYYSGHSDESGLLLGESVYPYPKLKADLEAIGADVRVAVLDSCASGALVRTKGGVQRPAFLEDRSNDVEGTAYLMSSSADEAAQESDAVEASFFTHYLVSGMRGGADTSQDGRVTLDEAYRYAKAETLRRTERTSIGPQHATYSYKLGGHGDFVFTDLSTTSASLVLDESHFGRFFVRNDEGHLVAELDKSENRAVELALRPGLYTVVWDQGSAQYDTVFEIHASENVLLGQLAFSEFQGEVAVARGSDEPVEQPSAKPAAPPKRPKVMVKDGWETPGKSSRAPRARKGSPVSLGIARSESAPMQVGVVGTSAQSVDGMQAALVFNEVDALRGMQASVASNQAHTLYGMQLALGANFAGGGAGWQNALVVNVAERTFRGVQSGSVNVAHEVEGVQVGFVNRAESANGIQLGLVNSGGDGEGLQVGLVNIAGDYDGVGVGLVTVHQQGYNHIFVNAGTLDPLVLSGTWGSKYLYTHVQLGLGKGFSASSSTAIGLGLHVPMRKFYLDGDLAGGYRFGRDGDVLARARLQTGWSPKGRFGMQMGVVLETGPNSSFGQANEWFEIVGFTAGLRF